MEVNVSKNTADCKQEDNNCDAEKSKLNVKTETNTNAEVLQIPFHCVICNFQMCCDYKGNAPHFAKNIQFSDECYVIKDPFSPPPGNLSTKSLCEHFIVIGSDCSYCNRSVCQLNSCSIFYHKFYCSDCAFQLLNTFPVEVQCKIRKFCRRLS